MTRKVDPVVECICAANYPWGPRQWETDRAFADTGNVPAKVKTSGWIVKARRIKRALSRAGWLKEGRR